MVPIPLGKTTPPLWWQQGGRLSDEAVDDAGV